MAERHECALRSGVLAPIAATGSKRPRRPIPRPASKSCTRNPRPGKVPGYRASGGVVGMVVGNHGKDSCIPLAAELHEGALACALPQGKKPPEVNGVEKTSVVTLMAEPCNRDTDAPPSPVSRRWTLLCRRPYVWNCQRRLIDTMVSESLHIMTRAKNTAAADELHRRTDRGWGRRTEIWPKNSNLRSLSFRVNDSDSRDLKRHGETKTSAVVSGSLVRPCGILCVLCRQKNGNRLHSDMFGSDHGPPGDCRPLCQAVQD